MKQIMGRGMRFVCCVCACVNKDNGCDKISNAHTLPFPRGNREELMKNKEKSE